MISKIKNSLAYRLPMLYKALLNRKKIAKQAPKEQLNATVITMTGKRLIGMTRIAILSIARSWPRLPKLTIVTDGTISISEVRTQLAFWPGELEVNDWENTYNYHAAKNRGQLIKYSGEHIMGRKLSVILHYAEVSPVIWLDSDILFFSDLSTLVPDLDGADFICGGSEDYSATYDERVLEFYGNDLYKKYRFNAGALYIYGENIYERFNIDALLAHVSTYPHYFTEQTVFGHIASQSLGVLWNAEIIKNFNDDNQWVKPMPVKDVVARHYTTNVRHLFWRDAYFHLR